MSMIGSKIGNFKQAVLSSFASILPVYSINKRDAESGLEQSSLLSPTELFLKFIRSRFKTLIRNQLVNLIRWKKIAANIRKKTKLM